MNEKTMLFKMLVGHHFISAFQNLKFRGIEVARYLFHDFIEHLACYDLDEMREVIPGMKKDVIRSDVFSLVDTDYPYNVKPGQKIFVHPWEFLKDVIPLLPADRLIVTVGRKVANPAAAEKLKAEAEMVLKGYLDDYVFGNTKFHDWLFKNLTVMVTESDQLADLFDQEEISCVVTRFAFSWPYYWPARGLVWLAKSRRIPSIAYQPGVIIGCDNRAEKWWPFADIPIVATFKTVWGPRYKEFFTSFGVPGNRLPMIGNPHFDKIFAYQATANSEFRKKYDIPASHQIILHPTEAPNYRRLATVSVAAEAIKNLPDTTLLIKTRDMVCPEEKVIYNEIIADHPRIKLISEDQPIYDLIANSDVVLVFFSTCGLEAMLFGKPVVVIDVKNETPPFSYAQYLGAPEVQNAAELRALLGEIMTNPEFVRKIRENVAECLSNLLFPEGKALPRLAELILKVADGQYRLR